MSIPDMAVVEYHIYLFFTAALVYLGYISYHASRISGRGDNG